MKITLCGSIAFIREMEDLAKRLQALGHEVQLPSADIELKDGRKVTIEEFYLIRKQANPSEEWIWDEKERAIQRHFQKIVWSDAILVANYDKKGVTGYIGANTLMEMGLALFLHKPIYLLKAVPDMNYAEEIRGVKPRVIHEDLERIK